MRIEQLGLHHKDELAPLLRAITVPLSEYCFANLYLFRESHGYEVLSDGDIFIKAGRTTVHVSHADQAGRTVGPGPFAGAPAGRRFPFSVPRSGSAHLTPATTRFRSMRATPITLHRGENEHPCRAKAHKKRNLLKQFLEAYRHEALPLTNDHLDQARSVLDGWQKDTGLDAGQTDYGPCREALDRYEELVLCGASPTRRENRPVLSWARGQ